MADPWLASGVLGELDEANARYFAVTLHDHYSRYYLEIPESFAAETGWSGQENCALVTSISTLKEWPLQIRRLHDVSAGVAAVSVGGGWAKFVEDQKLGFGAFLTFELVDERRLVVALHNRRRPEELHQPEALQRDNALLRDLLERDLPEAGERRHRPIDVLSEAHASERPHFRKTLRKTHTQKGEASRMDVPTAYWRTAGVEEFDGVWYTLHGPLMPCVVKTSTHTR